ncbi:MAG: hypothetical protein K9I85_10315 [Saprospiraceae bacterium]|nr:hypothetical protein [Saprospiraceae bacterium]
MNLQIIQESITGYTAAFLNRPHAHLWAVQQQFQASWDLQAIDLADMFDRSLQSDVNRRMWSREGYQPKEIMLLFIRLEPHLVHTMFLDLFRKDKDLQGRISRFQHHADELLQHYQDKGLKPAYAGHDQDLQIISLYLALRYPADYAPYHHAAFVHAMSLFRVRELPIVPDPDRWMKVARTLLNLMKKNDDLMDRYAQFRRDPRFFQEDTLLLAWDFVQWLWNKNGSAY